MKLPAAGPAGALDEEQTAGIQMPCSVQQLHRTV